MTREHLLTPPSGTRTEAGLRHNVRVGVLYLEAWLRGEGCVPIYNLMEDAATAEIARAQVWQWVHHSAAIEGDNAPFALTRSRLRSIVNEETDRIVGEIGQARFAFGRFAKAKTLFERLCTADALDDFLTLAGYEELIRQDD